MRPNPIWFHLIHFLICVLRLVAVIFYQACRSASRSSCLRVFKRDSNITPSQSGSRSDFWHSVCLPGYCLISSDVKLLIASSLQTEPRQRRKKRSSPWLKFPMVFSVSYGSSLSPSFPLYALTSCYLCHSCSIKRECITLHDLSSVHREL